MNISEVLEFFDAIGWLALLIWVANLTNRYNRRLDCLLKNIEDTMKD